jgi:hypothetical protein
VDTAAKLLGFVVSLTALAGVVVLALASRPWYTGQVVRGLREDLRQVYEQMTRKDQELRDLRLQEKAHLERLTHFEERYRAMDQLEKERRLTIFSQERYIERCEQKIIACGETLPERDSGG